MSKVNIEVEVTEEMEENLLTGAIEGGSNSWYWLGEDAIAIINEVNTEASGLSVAPLSTKMWKTIKAGKSIPIRDIENKDEILGLINMQAIVIGEQLMAKNHSLDFLAIIDECDDASTADMWFQYAIFKEVIYG